MRTALTIAGSDSSGGAGIQADIKTMMANGVYAMSAITALTAQNTVGVKDIMESSPDFLAEQIDCVFTDIFPDAVKTGMIPGPEHIEVIAERLKFYNAGNIVVDPVMVATSGSELMKKSALDIMKEKLFPLAAIITPNIPEAEIITGMRIATESDMENAAVRMNRDFACAVLVKGGHAVSDANDVLVYDGGIRWFKGTRINNPNTHGTGCTLSSAIASNLAKGATLDMAVKRAKDYISDALSYMLDLGKGSGPMNHGFGVDYGAGTGVE